MMLFALLLPSCSDIPGPSVAVTLRLYSIDGMLVPATLRSAGGTLVTVGDGRLQGTNWGYACGMVIRLNEGPVTAADVPDCRLEQRQERTFTVALSDSRFPPGPHQYRFVP